jgi:hypothetical protein
MVGATVFAVRSIVNPLRPGLANIADVGAARPRRSDPEI